MESLSNFQLLEICISLILGACGVATIFVNGWVKASHVAELKKEVDMLWKEIGKLNILETKIEAIEKGIEEIKELIRNK